ncbi:MAG: hypothetical protein WBE76_27030 [Terracidiphilus sp.]
MQTTKSPSIRNVTFAVTVNNREVFENNFLASPCFRGPHDHQILIQEGFTSATKALNRAIDNSLNDLIVFCHQDIILPENWLLQLDRALSYLGAVDPQWGVLGPAGKTQDGRGWEYVYSSGRNIVGVPFDQPVPVQTLDEIVLIMRKSSGLRFDDQLPHFHFYGADICLRAASMGMKSYAISAFCVHNTHQPLVLPREFYECCKHIKRVWKAYLPIQTTCIRITAFNLSVYTRRLREVYLRYIRRKEFGGTRTQNTQTLIEELVRITDKPSS